jgi:small ligand-binding sensory domain FIST
MIRAGVGTSTQAEARSAGAQATAAALEEAGGAAQAAILFAGPGYSDDLSLLLDAVVSELGSEAVVGASAHGVLAKGLEYEEETAVVVLAWSGLEVLPFLIADTRGDALAACEELAARLGGPARPEDLVVVLPDPGSFDLGALLAGLREVLGPVPAVGAGAADALSGASLQWCGRVVAAGGIAGAVLRGARPPRIGVTQACLPVTELLTVTRVRGHWLLELDGRPALEVYRETARGPLAEDLRRAASFLLVALPADPEAERLEPGSYLVRHVVGFETGANAFAIPVALEPGARIALVQREPETAREDLKAMLERVGGAPPGTPPALGLYFDCCARGAGLFGMPGLEAAYLERFFGPAPIAGMFGSCEIGPIGGRSELLTHTGVLALIDS